MNSVHLLGNLGQTPQLRHVGSGKAVLNFSLAVDKPTRSGNRQLNDTNWFDVTVWGASAEHQARYLTKGSKVLIEGELNQRNWTDSGGNKRVSIEVIARRITWIDLKTAEATEPAAAEATAS